MLNYNHLYYFHVFAEFGTLQKAADFLKIRQPSLSVQLKSLESTLKNKLMIKKGRNLELTRVGKLVHDYTKHIFSLSEELLHHLQDEPRYHQLRVGISSQIERPLVSEILPLLSPTLPKESKTTFSILSGKDVDLIEKLKFSKIDLLFVDHRINESTAVELVRAKIPVLFYISTELCKKLRINKKMSFSKIIRHPKLEIVAPSDNQTLRHETDIYLKEQGIQKNIAIESNLLSVLGRSILQGSGGGFYPHSYFHYEESHKLVHAFGPRNGFWNHEMFIYCNKANAKNFENIELQNKILKLVSLS